MTTFPHRSLTHPKVSDRDYKRFLRFPPRRAFEGPLAENAAWARTWFAEHARPWLVVTTADAALAPRLSCQFPGETEFLLIAASAGAEAEAEAAARWEAGEPDRYFFLECFASAAVEALLTEARRLAGARIHRCPGFPGWSIDDNRPLLASLQGNLPLPGPLEVLTSGMLRPKKSQLAVCPSRDCHRAQVL